MGGGDNRSVRGKVLFLDPILWDTDQSILVADASRRGVPRREDRERKGYLYFHPRTLRPLLESDRAHRFRPGSRLP